jgi:hypothetical protein
VTITDSNPPVTPFLDGSSVEDTHQHDDLSDLQNALNELSNALPAYREAEQYYDGTAPEWFASLRLQRALADADDPYEINFAKKPVDIITEKLKITAVTVPDNEQANAALQEIWKRNELAIQSKDMLHRAGEYGDAYIYVWPGEQTDNGDVTAVDMFYNSPHCCRIFYDTENPLKAVMAIKKWIVRNKVRVNMLYPDRIEKYVTESNVRHAHVSESDLVPFDDPADDDAAVDEDGWLVNPFDALPVFHLRNTNPYGVPEHRDMYGVQNIINKLILGHMSTVDYAAIPQRWALADPEVGGGDPDDDDQLGINFDSDEDAVADDPQSQLSADPGSLWYLQGVKGVGQFDTADPKGFIDPMLTYLRFGAQVTDIPVHRIDPTGAVQSGDSRRLMQESFWSKVEDRQTRYGSTFRAAFKFALKLLGYDDVDVVITWAPVNMVDDTDGWTVIQAKINAGMPPSQAFLEAGYTQQQVDAWFPYDEDTSIPARVDILLKLGQALQALGAASGFQLIDPQVISRLIDLLLASLDEKAEQEDGLAQPPRQQQLPVAAGVNGGNGDRANQPD